MQGSAPFSRHPCYLSAGRTLVSAFRNRMTAYCPGSDAPCRNPRITSLGGDNRHGAPAPAIWNDGGLDAWAWGALPPSQHSTLPSFQTQRIMVVLGVPDEFCPAVYACSTGTSYLRMKGSAVTSVSPSTNACAMSIRSKGSR